MKRVVIWIFGKQLGRNGEVPEELSLQMEKGMRLLVANEGSVMLITGGRTQVAEPDQPEIPSEARAALDCLPEGLWSWVILEDRSLSTRQNLIYGSEELLRNDIQPSKIIAVSSRGHEERISYLFKTILPAMFPMLTFDSVGKRGLLQCIEHKLIYWMTIDGRDEKYFLPLKRKLIAFRRRFP